MNIGRKVNVIKLQEWNDLVVKTYGRPYDFQQQNGTVPRGIYGLRVPEKDECDHEMHDSIPEVVNGDVMGVKFKVWLARDPKQLIPDQTEEYQLRLFWTRNFYPDIQIVANDLYGKGLIDKGEYYFNINW